MGLWSYTEKAPIANEEIYSISNHGEVLDWRLGSPDWHGTKLSIRATYDDRNMLRAGKYTNIIDEVDLSERDTVINLYFAEMVRGYLGAAVQEDRVNL